MESPAEKKQIYKKWVFFALAAVLLTAAFLACKWRQRETEYAIIQKIIEVLPDYQDEIESWGYQVSVLSRFTEMQGDEGLMHYYYESAVPVLVLTDPDGGRYCFYYGFDQYISEAVKQESVLVLHPEREYVDALKTVRLQIYKRDIDSAPLPGNTAGPDSREYYDMAVRLGNDILGWDISGFHSFLCNSLQKELPNARFNDTGLLGNEFHEVEDFARQIQGKGETVEWISCRIGM